MQGRGLCAEAQPVDRLPRRSAAANQPLSAMPSDYANLPTVSFLIPNLCHDMHDCSIAEGDRWLAQNIDHYARGPGPTTACSW